MQEGREREREQLAGAKWLTAFHAGAILLSFGGLKKWHLFEKRNERHGRRQTPLLPQFRRLVWPVRPPVRMSLFISLSLSFLGFRISKSLAVKSAAALPPSLLPSLPSSLSFCPACHARFWTELRQLAARSLARAAPAAAEYPG